MDAEARIATPQALERDVFSRIPLAGAMGVRVDDYGDGRLVLAAPFEPNVNHAGIAFGGAIEVLGTLACWSLLWLLLGEPDAMTVIQHGETAFRRPLKGRLHAVARAPGDGDLERLRETLARHGRARIKLAATVGDAATPEGARFRGCFAVARQDAAERAANASDSSKR